MNFREEYRRLTALLESAGIPDAATDARLMLEQVCGASFANIISGVANVGDGYFEKLEEMLSRRIAGEPLQYIFGTWDFVGRTFEVGDGVLIPRPETEQLVDMVVEKLRGYDSPVVYDLCSGSGCIGLTIKAEVPSARVFLVEKSDKALSYLNRNRALLGLEKTTVAIQGDVLNVSSFSSLPVPDVIVSNPPYIETDVIPTLQREVRREPAMALDGGADGLDFYRVLCSDWFAKLNNGGFMALESGENQPPVICTLFPETAKTQTANDFAGVERFVFAFK